MPVTNKPWTVNSAAKAVLISIALSLLLGACSEDSVEDDAQSNLEVNQKAFSAATDAAGKANFSFLIPAGVTSFALEAFSDQGSVRLLSLNEPGGNRVTDLSSEAAHRPEHSENSPHCVNFPFLPSSVTSGVYSASYLLTAEASGKLEPLAGQEIRLVLNTKSDGDVSQGTLKVNLILVGATGQDQQLTSDLQKSLGIWKEIYDKAGIALDAQWYQFSGPATLPDPRSADAFYLRMASQTRPDAVNIVLGSQVSGVGTAVNNSSNRYGLAGSSPGPLSVTAKSVIAISVLSVTGPDGLFDYLGVGGTQVHNDEKRLAAEEMARLTGEYLGLSAIVQVSGNTVTAADTLSDTPSCVTLTGCRDVEQARSNLMFPFPLNKIRRPEDGTDSDDWKHPVEYYPRDLTSAQQAAVLNNTVFVD